MERRFLLQLSDPEFPMEPTLAKIGDQILNLYPDDIEELVACKTEIMFYFMHDQHEKFLSKVTLEKLNLKNHKSNLYRIPVVFNDSKDWEEVEKQTGLKKSDIVERIISETYTFEHFGFRPGFYYLNGLPSELHCQRKENPDLNVLPGSVALGGEYIGIYGQQSPAGWQIIGRIDEKLNQLLPSFLKIGDHLKFIPNE